MSEIDNKIALLKAQLSELNAEKERRAHEQDAKWETKYGVKLGSIHPMNDALAELLRSRSKTDWDANFFIGKYSPFKVHSFEPKGKTMLLRITSENGGWTIGGIPIEAVVVSEGEHAHG